MEYPKLFQSIGTRLLSGARSASRPMLIHVNLSEVVKSWPDVMLAVPAVGLTQSRKDDDEGTEETITCWRLAR